MNIGQIKNNYKYTPQSAQIQKFGSNVQCSNSTKENFSNPFKVLPQGYAPINFTSRAEDRMEYPTPRLKEQMDFSHQVMLNVKKEFPSISPSKVMNLFHSKKNANQYMWLNKKQNKIDKLRENYEDLIADSYKFEENIFENTRKKDSHLANCFELTQMTEVALKMNGVKNVTPVYLVGYTNPKHKSTYPLDHTFLVVNGHFEDDRENIEWDKPKEKYGKNAYVVDPWLGIVDTMNNAMKIYSETWEDIPHYNQIVGYGCEIEDSIDINKKDIDKFSKKYPELIIDKNFNRKRFDV